MSDVARLRCSWKVQWSFTWGPGMHRIQRVSICVVDNFLDRSSQCVWVSNLGIFNWNRAQNSRDLTEISMRDSSLSVYKVKWKQIDRFDRLPVATVLGFRTLFELLAAETAHTLLGTDQSEPHWFHSLSHLALSLSNFTLWFCWLSSLSDFPLRLVEFGGYRWLVAADCRGSRSNCSVLHFAQDG